MLAKVNGVFRLSQDIEMRYLNDGKALAKLNLVNSEKFKKQSGEQVENSCFIEGVVFGRLAEVANQYLRKGSKVYVCAELKQDTWQNNEGQKRSKHTLKIESFEMLDSKSDNQAQQPQGYNQQAQQQPQVVYERQQPNLPEVDVDSEIIPF